MESAPYGELFGPTSPIRVVLAVTPSPKKPRRAAIRVGEMGKQGRTVATLSTAAIERLQITPGTEWTPEIEEKTRGEATYERVLEAGMKMINRRALSEAEVRKRLAARGHEPAHVDRAIRRMLELGLIDDTKLAAEIVDLAHTRRPTGEAMLRDKLARKGIGEGTIDGTLAEHRSQNNPVDEAVRLATKKLVTLRGLDPATRRRRLFGLLARRGFDEETVRAAMEKIGEVGDADYMSA
ncbi:MAG: recombination regulator RecX [Planctomycetes bacterium]|nr:recombination regulator RecX [Planctomycetota bacterium]